MRTFADPLLMGQRRAYLPTYWPPHRRVDYDYDPPPLKSAKMKLQGKFKLRVNR